MNKRFRLLAALVLGTALLTQPALAATNSTPASNTAEQGKEASKHNFDQWQTIKRLQVPSQPVPR